MTQVHFTLNNEEVQSIIEHSVKDDVSKNILTTVFNQLMENQRTEYIQAEDYERSESRQSQRNGYYERDFTTRVGTLELKVPRTRDGELSNEEQKLLYIWKKVIDQDFEVGTISKTETFFEVGGDSIKLPELLHEINNEYNISVSAEELLNSFTLQEQASMIIQMQSKPIVCTKTNKFLIQLKKGYSKKNVVLIHAGSGEIGIYNELSKNIDNSYNVYAIRFDKNTDNLSPRIFDFPDLARRYNEYLTDFESIDYIGGWCIGGTIGYEICKINNNIKNLLLINTLPPVKEKQQIFQFNLESELEFIKKSFGYTPINVASMDNLWSEIVRLIDNNPKTMKKLVSIVPQELSRLIPFFGENSPKELIYYINLFRSFETARKLYQETGVIPNNICYIGANEEVIPAYEDWRKRIKGTWSEAHVTGDHTTIFDNPNVIKLAEFINNHSEQGGD